MNFDDYVWRGISFVFIHVCMYACMHVFMYACMHVCIADLISLHSFSKAVK